MSIFGRGNWAVFGVEPESMAKFQESLGVDLLAFKNSQFAAGTAIKFHGLATAGMNPYGQPRLDEQVGKEFPVECLALLKAIEKEETIDVDWTAIRELIPNEGTLSLGNKAFAFWMVMNDPKDVTDPASKKEDLSYQHFGRPFKFLAKKEKEVVEEQVNASAVMSRKQFPVIVDFQHGRVYAESTAKDDLLALRATLDELGAKTFSLCWSFGDAEWPSFFLNKIYNGTRYSAEMKSRADELAKFRPDEVEKLEDKEMEKIVSAFFAFTPLENEFVACLGCPSQVRIHKVSDPVGVTSPSVSFTLMEMTNDPELAGANLTIMQPVAKKVKGGGEKIVNKPVLSVDINPNVNNFDAGAALLRGFDMPEFRKHVKLAIKAQGGLQIKDFWAIWLTDMHDATLTIADSIINALALEGGGNYGLAVIGTEADSSEEIKDES